MLYLCRKVTMTPTHQMETPIEYKRNYREGKVSREMICDCIYSLNQRRKRYNDWYNLYNNWIQHSIYVTDSLKQRANASYEKVREYTNAAIDLLLYLRPSEIQKHRRWDAEEQKEHEDYYIIYKEGDYVFRRHIPAGCTNQYDLNVIEISEEPYTEIQEELTDLLDIKFVKKVYNGLRDGTLRIEA